MSAPGERYLKINTHYDSKLQGCLLYVHGVASDAHIFDVEPGAETFVNYLNQLVKEVIPSLYILLRRFEMLQG